MKDYLFTSESVSEGHPDKVCDQISDAILDEVLRQDPNGRVACEVAINDKLLLIMGEISTSAIVDYSKVAKNVLEDIGYFKEEDAFGLRNIQIIVSLNEQSIDIADGVNENGGLEEHNGLGAGDQGLMIGYACNETKEFMPLPITLAHSLTRGLEEARKNGIIPYLKPDGKAQITMCYKGNIPEYIHTIVLSTQHEEGIDISTISNDIKEKIINKTIPLKWINQETRILINPTGRFVVGGPRGDSGLTGRKIIVDTYGGIGRHGGGAFSGKDPSKVDRSGAYMARYLAKNIVAAGLAEKCEVELAFAIGSAEPIGFTVNSFNTGVISDDEIYNLISMIMKLDVSSIIDYLDLKQPIYSKTSSYGHFGKPELPWEALDLSEQLKIKFKTMNMNLNSWFETLTLEKIVEISDYEILQYIMERPGYKGQYGFLISPDTLSRTLNGSEILYFLMKRITDIPKEQIENILKNR